MRRDENYVCRESDGGGSSRTQKERAAKMQMEVGQMIKSPPPSQRKVSRHIHGLKRTFNIREVVSFIFE